MRDQHVSRDSFYLLLQGQVREARQVVRAASTKLSTPSRKNAGCPPLEELSPTGRSPAATLLDFVVTGAAHDHSVGRGRHGSKGPAPLAPLPLHQFRPITSIVNRAVPFMLMVFQRKNRIGSMRMSFRLLTAVRDTVEPTS